MLGQRGHKSMQRRDEILFDALWPVVLTEEFVDVVALHLVEEVVQRVPYNWNLTLCFKEIAKTVVFGGLILRY